jgi:small subunit ribosomal protein S20
VANSPQARKRARQTDKRRLHNNALRSRMRTSVKKFQKAAEAGEVEAAASAFGEAQTRLARAARKGLTHDNTAARAVGRMARRLNSLREESPSA